MIKNNVCMGMCKDELWGKNIFGLDCGLFNIGVSDDDKLIGEGFGMVKTCKNLRESFNMYDYLYTKDELKGRFCNMATIKCSLGMAKKGRGVYGGVY